MSIITYASRYSLDRGSSNGSIGSAGGASSTNAIASAINAAVAFSIGGNNGQQPPSPSPRAAAAAAAAADASASVGGRVRCKSAYQPGSGADSFDAAIAALSTSAGGPPPSLLLPPPAAAAGGKLLLPRHSRRSLQEPTSLPVLSSFTEDAPVDCDSGDALLRTYAGGAAGSRSGSGSGSADTLFSTLYPGGVAAAAAAQRPASSAAVLLANRSEGGGSGGLLLHRSSSSRLKEASYSAGHRALRPGSAAAMVPAAEEAVFPEHSVPECPPLPLDVDGDACPPGSGLRETRAGDDAAELAFLTSPPHQPAKLPLQRPPRVDKPPAWPATNTPPLTMTTVEGEGDAAQGGEGGQRLTISLRAVAAEDRAHAALTADYYPPHHTAEDDMGGGGTAGGTTVGTAGGTSGVGRARRGSAVNYHQSVASLAGWGSGAHVGAGTSISAVAIKEALEGGSGSGGSEEASALRQQRACMESCDLDFLWHEVTAKPYIDPETGW